MIEQFKICMIFGIKAFGRPGSFNATISAQNSLLRVGGTIVDRKEVMFGKIDQMSRRSRKSFGKFARSRYRSTSHWR